MAYLGLRGFLESNLMNNLKLACTGLLLLLALQACKQKTQSNTHTDGPYSGSAVFAGDESFQPIVDEEEYVFTALNSKAKPVIIYRPESDVVRLLMSDSVRVALLSRKLDSNEVKILKTRNLTAAVSRFAIDAVVLIVNKVSNDTLMTVNGIKKMLNGQAKTGENIVFDNAGSSLVSYLKKLAGINDLKLKNIFALKNNKEVIRYVSTHPGAIGITDFSWMDDPDDDYANAVSNTKIVAIRDEGDKKYGKQYFQPSQTSLALKQYPLSRDLYIINCTDRMGLGTGFAMFLTSDRGQRIILKSGLLPDSIPEREIVIKKGFN
jgi:phosphate transport system substrate-binding protein